jgi:lysine-specific demethylase 8/jumonji domain-containing protein 7
VPIAEITSPEAWHRLRVASPGPYLLRGAIASDAALRRWSRAYLTAAAGDRRVPVEYSVRGITRPDPRINGGRHLRMEMSLADALSAIDASPLRGVTHYVSAVNLAHWLPELEVEVALPPFLDRNACLGAYLFAGGDGTGTVLHYDPTDNYVLVLEGGKDCLLLPPGGLRELAVTPVWQPFSGISRLSPEQVNAHALRRGARRCVVQPFEILYIPRGWWHCVHNRGLTLGVSLSFAWPARSLLSWRQARLCFRMALDRWFADHAAIEACVDRGLARLGWWRARRPR